MAGLQKGLPLQPTSRFNHDDDEHIPSKKRKLEEIATEEIQTDSPECQYLTN